MKDSNWRFSGRSSIRNRIFLLGLVVSLSVVLIMGFTYTYFIKHTIENHFKDILISLVEYNATSISNLLNNAYKNALRISNDPKFQAVLRQKLPDSYKEIYSLELEMDNQLSFVQNYVDQLFGFHIVGENGMEFKSNFSSSIDQDWQELPWYHQIVSQTEPTWFDPHDGSFTVNTIGQPLVTLGLPITDKVSGKILGVLLTDIEVKTISEIIRSGMRESGHFTLTSAHGTPIAQSQLPHNREESTFSYTIQLPIAGWELTGYYHPSIITSTITAVIKPILFLMLVLEVFVLLAAYSIAKRITAPLTKLVALMQRIQEGDFRVTMPIVGNDELDALASAFNMMVSQINQLMNSLNKEHEKLRLAEIRTLEAQINPHFLYNTLESIIWLSRKGQMEDVTNLVFSLSNLLRIGLNQGRTMITIAEEIEHIKNYLLIQQTRFPNEFSYTVEIDEAIMNSWTPKLILQPLVENAIIHGIQPSEHNEIITISARETGDNIVLVVYNTGKQINPERLDQINAMLDRGEEMNGGLGLRNVNERIKLYLGKQYGLTLKSTIKGTEATVTLPRM